MGYSDLKFIAFFFFNYVQGNPNFEYQSTKNILFIASDDLRPVLGCYSDVHPGFDSPKMHTPNLDALADESILFERAYVQQAVCSPSRTSLLTGRRPDTTRVTDLEHYFRDIGGNFTTIPQFFKENGYRSIGMGKIFHHGEASGNDDPISWSEEYYHATDYYKGNESSWRALTFEQSSVYPPQDTLLTQHAISKIRELSTEIQKDNTPFFLAIGLKKPHLPFIFPENFLSFYPKETIVLPDNSYVPTDMPDIAWAPFGELRGYEDASNDGMGIPDLGEMNITYPDYKVKELRRAYYAAVSYIDDSIGQILKELRSVGLDRNTLVVFWGDHGWQLGEHTEWCKHTNFEVATHAPLILRVPGLTDGGIRTSKLVEFVDIFPTLVEVAGMEPLKLCPLNSNDVELCTEGSSLVPLIINPENQDWKEAVFWQYPRGHMLTDAIRECMGYSICTNTYHYTEWVNIKVHVDEISYEPEWDNPCEHSELYDLKIDPKENKNVYNSPQYKDITAKLSARLRAGWRNEIKM